MGGKEAKSKQRAYAHDDAGVRTSNNGAWADQQQQRPVVVVAPSGEEGAWAASQRWRQHRR